jgi:hypothetical protein
VHMSTLKKGIKKIYIFHLNGMPKFGTQNLQNAIDMPVHGLTDTEQNLVCNFTLTKIILITG